MTGDADLKQMMRSVIEEFVSASQRQSEPAYRTELQDERRRREQLEKRVNELVEENKRSSRTAEETERFSQIRAELHRLGVTKVDVALKVVKDDIVRGADGNLVARTGEGERPVREFLGAFVQENPEFLPARIAGGSGALSPQKGQARGYGLDIDRIRPGMSAEELQRVREQVSQVAWQSLRGE